MFQANNRELNEQIIQTIVQKYIENEDKNFSLFNYANDLRAEVEKKEEELFKLKEELTQAKKKKDQTESGLKLEQQLLDDQLKLIQVESKKLSADCDEMSNQMVGVFGNIEKLNQVAGLEQQNINGENVLLVLSEIEGVIDGRVNKLL